MADNGNYKAVSDEQIIAALLTHGTIQAAAEATGLSPRSVYERMGHRSFKSAYSAAKADILRSAVQSIQDNLANAIDTVASIMQSESVKPGTRLAAAKLILDSCAKYADRLAEADASTGTYAHPAMCSDPDLL